MTTIDVNITRLANFNGYLNSILAEFPATEGENEQEDPLVLTLVCFQKALERRITKTVPTVEWIDAMKWSVVQANKLLDQIYDKGYEFVEDWNPTDPPTNQQQALTAVLMLLCHELLADIAEGEEYLANELTTAADECQGRSKTRPLWRSKSRPVDGREVVAYLGEKGRWSVAEAALLPRGAFGGGSVSVRRLGSVCGGSA